MPNGALAFAWEEVAHGLNGSAATKGAMALKSPLKWLDRVSGTSILLRWEQGSLVSNGQVLGN